MIVYMNQSKFFNLKQKVLFFLQKQSFKVFFFIILPFPICFIKLYASLNYSNFDVFSNIGIILLFTDVVLLSNTVTNVFMCEKFKLVLYTFWPGTHLTIICND